MEGSSKVIFLVGFMGSGKTYYGKLLSALMGLPFFDLDDVIEKQEGMSIAEIFQKKGESYFRELEASVLRTIPSVFSTNIKINDNNFPIFGVLSCGGGTPCFHRNMEWMNENGFTVWIAPSPEYLVMRLKGESHSRPLIAGLQDDELKVQVAERLKARVPYYRQAKLIITNPSISVQELHEQILHAQALL
jgi:shikimate kinase